MRFRVPLTAGSARLSSAQQEVIHPGETYDSIQAGHDAYWEAEAERRAKIGRQLMLEEQIQAENTWSDPQDKYRPVRPESYGPVRPKVYAGPTLADVYAYPSSGVIYYNSQSAALKQTCRCVRRFPFFSLGRACRAISGHALLRLRAATDRPREDLDRAAELHLQAGLCVAGNGTGVPNASARSTSAG